MKKTTIICCMLLCSLVGLFACTKNRNDAQPVPPPSGSDSTLPTDGDTLNPPKYAAGDTLILRGDTSNGDVTVLLYSGNRGVSTPDFPAFTALGKGLSETNDRTRSIMKFRIRNLDDSSRDNPPPVQKAVLYLYQYTDPVGTDAYVAQRDVDNSAELHRIVGDWQDSTISWHTQPALAAGSTNPLEDVVMIPAITTPLPTGANDNQVIDVTDMMRKIFADRSNKGFLLKLTNEGAKVGRSFGSFACPNVNKRPKLVVYF